VSTDEGHIIVQWEGSRDKALAKCVELQKDSVLEDMRLGRYDRVDDCYLSSGEVIDSTEVRRAIYAELGIENLLLEGMCHCGVCSYGIDGLWHCLLPHYPDEPIHMFGLVKGYCYQCGYYLHTNGRAYATKSSVDNDYENGDVVNDEKDND